MGVSAGVISAVAVDLPGESAAELVDASGLMLCPGFVDMHAHSALEPFRDPVLLPKIAQGFTTEVLHPDGLAPAPVTASRREERRSYLNALEGHGPADWAWTTFAEYLDALAETGPATTLVPSIGHNAVRDVVMGSERRAPGKEELEAMRREVRLGFESGARCLSFGLIYLPGMFAATDELCALAEEASRFGAPLVPHVRNEAGGVLEAIGELVDVARRSGAPLHLSHLKIVGHPELLEPLLELIDLASNEIDITFDQYPYGAGSTVLSALLPQWAQEGGPSAILERLADAGQREAIEHDVERGLPGWENLYRACGAHGIFVAHAGAARADDIGKPLTTIGAERGCDPLVAALDLLLDTALDVAMIDHYASEETVRAIFRHPLALVGSDGIFGARPHPRLYGTAARVLGRYALRERLVTVEQAVARLTARACARLGLRDRGRIAEGLRADLVLIDPAHFLDLATYEKPLAPPSGVARVVVAGETVWSDGRPTGARPGGVSREPLSIR